MKHMTTSLTNQNWFGRPTCLTQLCILKFVTTFRWEDSEDSHALHRYVVSREAVRKWFISHTIPCDWYIYLHEWLICVVNVSKKKSIQYMDPMG